MLDHTAYLARLGFDTPPPPTLDTLRALQQRHTAAIPFETLETLQGRRVPIDLPSIERKVLRDGRGGYCYELNQLFFALLQHLGFDVRPVTGRVVMNRTDDVVPARTHLITLATISGERWITDVGFGGLVPTGPLRLDTAETQATPHEPFRLVPQDGSYLLQAQATGEWRPLYVFDLLPQFPIDFEVGNWFVCAHPQSPFLGRMMVARAGPGVGVRHTFLNGDYAVHRMGEPSERRALRDVDEILALLTDTFGIRLPADDGALRRAVGEMLARQQAAAG